MSSPPPLLFEPIFQPKPWGGRALQRLFDKSLPGDGPIGESWELVSLPGAESRVRGGPQHGRTISDLITQFGAGLMGRAPLADGRFPLLIKFLDAREHLSLQVHPKPAVDDPAGWQPGIKHEAWCVVDAEPDAQLFIGLKPGVTPRDLAAAVNTPALADLLRTWPARRGDCYYLPSGTPHALGAGIVVAEVQTPSDVTYRLYDWGRVGLDGRPREMHLEAGLANIRFDVRDDEIVQPRSHVASVWTTVTRLARSARFRIDRLNLAAGAVQPFPHAEPVIWIVLSGAGRLSSPAADSSFRSGDVILIPADATGVDVHVAQKCEVLEVCIPTT